MACRRMEVFCTGSGSPHAGPSPTAATAAVTSPGRPLRGLGEVRNAAVRRCTSPRPEGPPGRVWRPLGSLAGEGRNHPTDDENGPSAVRRCPLLSGVCEGEGKRVPLAGPAGSGAVRRSPSNLSQARRAARERSADRPAARAGRGGRPRPRSLRATVRLVIRRPRAARAGPTPGGAMACRRMEVFCTGSGSPHAGPSPTAATAAVTSPGRPLRGLGEVRNAAVRRPPLPAARRAACRESLATPGVACG